MNIYTKNIASLLKITIEEAVRVQDQMEINGVDFSEVSTRTFNKEARAAAQEIASAKADQFESDLESLHQDLIDQNIIQDVNQLNDIFDKLVLENRII